MGGKDANGTALDSVEVKNTNLSNLIKIIIIIIK